MLLLCALPFSLIPFYTVVMPLLEDLNTERKRLNEKEQRRNARIRHLSSAFVFGTLIVAGAFIVVLLLLKTPTNDGRGGTSSFWDRLTNRVANKTNQSVVTVLPNKAAVQAIRDGLAKNDFALLTTPDVRSTKTNTTITYNVDVVRGEDFSADIAINTSRLPAGASATAEPSVVTKNDEDAVVTVVLPPTIATGLYNFDINGRAATIEKTAPITIAVSNLVVANVVVDGIRQMDEGLKWQATISWTSDVVAGSWIEYAPRDVYIANKLMYSATAFDQTLTKEHRLTLTNLEPGTRYDFRVKSSDASNNLAYSENFEFIAQ